MTKVRFWAAAWADDDFHYYAHRCGHHDGNSGFVFTQNRCPSCKGVIRIHLSKYDPFGPGMRIRFQG